MKTQGRIESVEKRETENWTRWQFIVSGKKYSTFDEKIGNGFKRGDIVEIETQQSKDGKFENMVSMKKITQMVEEEKGFANELTNVQMEKEKRICRMNCVTNALKQLELAGIKPESDIVINVAEYLFSYVYNGNRNNKAE